MVAHDPLPFEPCIFEVYQQRQFEPGNREISDQLVRRDSVEPMKLISTEEIAQTDYRSMPPIDSSYHFGRCNPATGVLIFRDRPTIVFLTVCTLPRVSTL